MDIYKEATKQKLLFNSIKGLVNISDLWDLWVEELDRMAQVSFKELTTSTEGSFLKKDTDEDTLKRLEFEVIKDVLLTKIAYKEEAEIKKAKLKEKEKLYALLERKKEEGLASLSVEELEAKIAEL